MSLPVLQFVHLLASGRSGLLAGSIERHAPPFTPFILPAKLQGRVSLCKLFFSFFLSSRFSLCLAFLSSSSFFQALTTWRLYFLPPKIPAKVIFFSLTWSFCRMSRFLWLRRLNSPLSNCIHDNRWKPRLTSWKSEPWILSQITRYVRVCVCVYLIACHEYRVVRCSSCHAIERKHHHLLSSSTPLANERCTFVLSGQLISSLRSEISEKTLAGGILHKKRISACMEIMILHYVS